MRGSVAAHREPLPSRREWVWLVWVPFAIAVVLTFAHTPDDALITLRYAWHVVRGQGPVFNPGEHVMGASSALHLLLSTGVVVAPHAWALVVAKLMSLLFGALALWQGALLVTASGLPRWARRVGYLTLSCSSMLALSAANGLETTLYVFLVTLLVRFLVVGRGTRAPLATAAVAGLVVLTRPDGALVVAALAFAGLLLEPRASRGRAVRWVLGGVLGVAIVVLGTFAFTGDPFPNTYYAKHIPVGRALADGSRYLETALLPGIGRGGSQGFLSALIFFAVVILSATGAVVLVRRRSRMAYTVAALVAQVAFALESGGDWMRGGRFLVPALASLTVVALTGVVAVVDRVARRQPELRRVAMVAGAGVLLAATFAPWTTEAAPVWRVSAPLDGDAFVAAGGYGQYIGVWTTIPHVLSCFPGARLATTEVGNAGWADPQRPVLDLRGLTDSVIAHDAPASLHRAAGVALGDWSSTESVTGRRIVGWRADLVVLLGDEARMPRTALGGRYVMRAMIPLRSGGRIAVYTKPGLPSSCTDGDRSA
jgi:hypothetical protein